MFSAGDRVKKNPKTWVHSGLEWHGRGEGVGVVTEPPFALLTDSVYVTWPECRCFEKEMQLLAAEREYD